ncbi:hypothetical protein [Methanoculleus nereidis]|nr:hypothetical protein [Methanoculleus sp. YWC-01]
MKGIKIQCSIDANYVFDLNAGGILEYPSHLDYTFLMANLPTR